jgi:membrane protein YdbS with pleckstrin-like domain
LKIDPVNMDALDRLNALKAPAIPPTPVNSTVAAAPSSTSAREAVILQQRMHRAMFISPVILVALAIALEIFFSQLSFGLTGFSGSFIVLLVIGAAIFELARTCLRYATSHIILTNKRIIIKRGYFNRMSFEILLTKVEGIGVKQSFLARLFGFGTLVVTGTGGARQRFLGLADPQSFRERVQAEIEALG